MPEPEAKYAALGNRLKEARLLTATRQRPVSEVSQERMAEMVGRLLGRTISQGNWSYWEQGRREPSLDVIRAAAQLSGLTPEYIAFGPPDDPQSVAPPSEPPRPVPKPALGKTARRADRAG